MCRNSVVRAARENSPVHPSPSETEPLALLGERVLEELQCVATHDPHPIRLDDAEPRELIDHVLVPCRSIEVWDVSRESTTETTVRIQVLLDPRKHGFFFCHVVRASDSSVGSDADVFDPDEVDQMPHVVGPELRIVPLFSEKEGQGVETNHTSASSYSDQDVVGCVACVWVHSMTAGVADHDLAFEVREYVSGSLVAGVRQINDHSEFVSPIQYATTSLCQTRVWILQEARPETGVLGSIGDESSLILVPDLDDPHAVLVESFEREDRIGVHWAGLLYREDDTDWTFPAEIFEVTPSGHGSKEPSIVSLPHYRGGLAACCHHFFSGHVPGTSDGKTEESHPALSDVSFGHVGHLWRAAV